MRTFAPVPAAMLIACHLAGTALAVTYTVTDLGTLPGGSQSYAYGINASGQVVGESYISAGNWHGLLYSGGVMTELATLGGPNSYGHGINASGQVVGWADPDTYTYPRVSSSHAFLYSGGSMTDLNSLIPPGSGGRLQEATGINDLGQIVGYGINPSGQTHAFLLTPNIIPEPSSFALLGIGALVLSLYGSRRRRRHS